MADFNSWEPNTQAETLNLLAGQTYNQNNPEQMLIAKKFEADHIALMLGLQQHDIVMDLGSGCGHLAKHIFPLIRQIHCVDISRSFLAQAQETLKDVHNIRYHHIDFACLPCIEDLTAIYSTAVFIHFNLYDCYLYLEQCYNALLPGGRMVFDFFDDRYVDIKSDRWQRHSTRYRSDRRAVFTNVHYNNSNTVLSMCHEIGFHARCIEQNNEQVFVLLSKPK